MFAATPAGFRDVLPQEALARETITRQVADLFASHGYLPIETPTLEVMDVMRAGGRMPASPFKFFDSHDDLLAMRPDVTLQIARMCATRLASASDPLKFRYTQRIFRESETENMVQARELTQCGVECIGEAGVLCDAEIIQLFVEALQLAGARRFVLALATVGVLRALLARSGAGDTWCQAVLDAYHDSDFVTLENLCAARPENVHPSTLSELPPRGEAAPAYVDAISKLAHMRGGKEVIARVRELVEPLGCAADLNEFETVVNALEEAGFGECLLIDFSLVSSFNYYTGMVFEAYAPGFGSPLGSGGRYDGMIAAYGVSKPAAGFAFYLENVMQAAALFDTEEACSKDSSAEKPLRIAVPKGSLNKDTIAALAEAGLDVTGLENPGRTLVIKNPGVEYIIVRPSDAPVFVALGAADCGICGKDSLLEVGAEVVELVDLRFGACRFVVAELAGTSDAIAARYQKLGSIRVATKYPSITRSHFARTGMQVEIVYLHGNIELAPLTGMAECIVDITATGTTLRENNLVVSQEVLSSTARFFANGCALRTNSRIGALARTLAENAPRHAYEPIAGAS
jgi:ATP phosphoribosyltransferase regulatory subunit